MYFYYTLFVFHAVACGFKKKNEKHIINKIHYNYDVCCRLSDSTEK